MATGALSSPSGKPAEGAHPFALSETGAGGDLLVAVNRAGRALGVEAGLTLTDAMARAPGLVIEPIDRVADRTALETLGAWMVRFSPLVALDGEDCLMLETTGCDHLFGGEAAMADMIADRLSQAGIKHRIGMAGVPGAAWALAHGVLEGPPAILPDGGEREGLAILPVSGLRLSEDTLRLLRRFGLNRIGQLYQIDRKALARRFASREMADAVHIRLDQALGLRREPLRPLTPPPDYAARLHCPEPLGDLDGVREGLSRLTRDVCAQLAAHGRGARDFALVAFRSDGSVSSAFVSAARAVRDEKHVLRLFREKIERVDPGFGIDLLLLEARRTGAMAAGAVALSGDLAASDVDEVGLAALSDRITAKLGAGTVRYVRQQESHIPERAETLEPYEGRLPAWETARHQDRPLRMLASPEPLEVLAEVPDGPPLRFVWRRVARKATRADGPERIAPEWWLSFGAIQKPADPGGLSKDWLSPKLDPRADAALIAKTRTQLEQAEDSEPELISNLPRARDYYRIEDEAGRRYWIYREGLYGDGRGGAPRWFMHGLFT